VVRPKGRPEGECEFPNEPAIPYQWDPSCFIGGLGCYADGINPECGFCDSPPFPACINASVKTKRVSKSNMVKPTGRLDGECEFDNEPAIPYQWNPNCFVGGSGCLADGVNPECSFCDSEPFPECIKSTTRGKRTGSATEHTTTTSTAALGTDLTSAVVGVDETVKDWSGRCLSARGGSKNGGGLQLEECTRGDPTQRWIQERNALRNEICLDSPSDDMVHMWKCYYHNAQRWSYDPSTGLLRHQRGECLEASGAASTIHLSACDKHNERQRWSIGRKAPPTLTLISQYASAVSVASAPVIGLLKLQDASSCLDSPRLKGSLASMRACDGYNLNQHWAYDPDTGLIQDQFGTCLESPEKGSSSNLVQMWTCNRTNPNQQWSYNAEAGRIKSRARACLGAVGSSGGSKVQTMPCAAENPNQRWVASEASAYMLASLEDGTEEVLTASATGNRDSSRRRRRRQASRGSSRLMPII